MINFIKKKELVQCNSALAITSTTIGSSREKNIKTGLRVTP